MRETFNFVATLVIVALVIYIGYSALDILGVWDNYRIERQLKMMTAQADAAKAETDLLKQRESFWTNLLLSFAPVKDSILMAASYLFNGVYNLVLSVIVVLLLLARNPSRRREDGKRKRE